MDDVVVRRATPSDAGSITGVYLAAFRATYEFPLVHADDEVARWIAEVLIPETETWVAERDGEVIGFMSLTAASVEQLYLAPRHTGRGIGSRLILLAKERRPAGLSLATFQVNDGARRFYERHGFQVVELGDGSTNEEGQPDVRYAWR